MRVRAAHRDGALEPKTCTDGQAWLLPQAWCFSVAWWRESTSSAPVTVRAPNQSRPVRRFCFRFELAPRTRALGLAILGL